MKPSLFRKEALDHMAAPEDLDQLIQVSSPRRWLMLAALSISLIVLVVWGFTGTVPSRVTGHGMFLAAQPAGASDETPAGASDETPAGDAADPPGGDSIRAVFYVPMQDGKKVRAGMPIQIAPVTVRPEEYGYMMGVVTRVSDFPATTESMLATLRNDRLVERWAGEDAPFEVEARLIANPAAPSGYAWTSGLGPNVDIRAGTPILSRVEIRTHRPIELILPSLRPVLSE